MTYKPFKPPLLVRRPSQAPVNPSSIREAGEPPTKRRRVSNHDEEAHELSDSPPRSLQAVKAPRKPLLLVRNPAAAEAAVKPAGDGIEGYYTVLWRKFTVKKHKTWDGDGILAVRNGVAHLQDISGKDLGKTALKTPLLPGSELSVGGKEVEVDSIISKEDFLAGRPFLGAASNPVVQEPNITEKLGFKAHAKQAKLEAKQVEKPKVVVPTSKATKTLFKNPVISSTLMSKANGPLPQPRHDPDQPGALIMKRPRQAPKGKQIVDVVVDPLLCKHLREHQKQGVRFLYECVMGMRQYEGEGTILADEMGLGKTLQTIALLWTLLKQNPIYEDPPVIKKALIVCPATLVNNWRKEFRKWLGNERIGVLVVDDKKTRLTDFTKGKSYSVMIIGYEKLRTVQDELKKGSGIDIVIADEGHRLKTAQNKSALAIKSLNTERRIILSGTPIQNDLSEFYVMVDFVNPGLLGKLTTFKREFENPILRSRQPGASAKDLEKGEARAQELADRTGQFILRRTAEILAKYLPPKTEYVLFCRPTTAQASVYRSVLSSPVFGAVLGNTESALQLINILKKVCNSPSLLSKSANEESVNQMVASILSGIPSALLNSPGASAKLQVLDSFLHQLRTTTSEKVVLVSNYTSTLDILGQLLTSLEYTFVRLDGSTPAAKRQGLVDKFNRTSASECFAFLLSAKSGGAGLNLIGASRLVLFDVDWNPSTDLQAMARIHRDGQKMPCRIYRLLTMGALDEKIYQRQLTKQGLADSVVDNKASASSFTREELRDLFKLDESGNCQTHELLCCPCGGRGNTQALELQAIPGADGDNEDSAKSVSPEEEDDGEDSDKDLPTLPALIKASEVDMEEQERRIEEVKRSAKTSDGKSKIKALMGYLHIDAAEMIKEEAQEELEALVDDDVLLSLLREEGSRVSFTFAKTSS
ncbi:helicase [Coniosporium apollinis]|uniref:Helicase n=1 Tax=Coniosporium apollinis TaxID=61459 RepID=A0ABQ9NU46_9PEZI|nr:helicase [Coniosporium apollinis]